VRRVLGSVAITAAVAFLVSGCSEIGFPAVHDMPGPRTDTTLTPDQIKQATDDLITQRDHLQAIPGVPPPTIPEPEKTSMQPAAPAATQTAGADSKP
jgi:hypothetical protein